MILNLLHYLIKTGFLHFPGLNVTRLEISCAYIKNKNVFHLERAQWSYFLKFCLLKLTQKVDPQYSSSAAAHMVHCGDFRCTSLFRQPLALCPRLYCRSHGYSHLYPPTALTELQDVALRDFDPWVFEAEKKKKNLPPSYWEDIFNVPKEVKLNEHWFVLVSLF